MGHDLKPILGLIAILVALISYIPYFRNILSGKTKPHAFTWLVWCILNAIAFAGQINGRAGAGSWSIGFTVLVMLVIFYLALKRGERSIKLFDWLCLISAGLAIIPWLITSNPLSSIIIITVIDGFGFLPTVRKSFSKPNQETLVTYSMSVIKYSLVVAALQKYTLITYLFPLSQVLMNGLFVLVVLAIRRTHKSTVT